MGVAVIMRAANQLLVFLDQVRKLVEYEVKEFECEVNEFELSLVEK